MSIDLPEVLTIFRTVTHQNVQFLLRNLTVENAWSGLANTVVIF